MIATFWRYSLLTVLLSGATLAGGGDAPITYRVNAAGDVEARQGARVLWRTPVQTPWNDVRALGNVLLVQGAEETFVLSRRDGRILARPAGSLVEPHASGDALSFFRFQGSTGDAVLTRLRRDWKADVLRLNLWSLFPPDCEARSANGDWVGAGVVRVVQPDTVVFEGVAGRCEGSLSADFRGNVGLSVERIK